MGSKIAALISYLLYGSVIFNVIYPNSAVISYIENYYVFYNILATIGSVICAFVIGLFAIVSYKLKKGEISFDDQETEQMKKAVIEFRSGLKKSRIRVFLGQVLSVVCGLAAFIILSQYYVGVMLLFGAFTLSMLRSQLNDIFNKMEVEANESA